jgi:hypothetical protein
LGDSPRSTAETRVQGPISSDSNGTSEHPLTRRFKRDCMSPYISDKSRWSNKSCRSGKSYRSDKSYGSHPLLHHHHPTNVQHGTDHSLGFVALLTLDLIRSPRAHPCRLWLAICAPWSGISWSSVPLRFDAPVGTLARYSDSQVLCISMQCSVFPLWQPCLGELLSAVIM